MSVASGKPTWWAVLRGLLFMRLCELKSRGSLVRLGVSFAVALILAIVAGEKNGGTGFWGFALNRFALGFLPFYCLVKGGETMRSELKEGTIEYLWTRPTRKAPLFIGFYLSSLVGVGAFSCTCLLAICGIGLAIGEFASIGQLATYVFICGMIAMAFSAVASAMGSYTSKFIVFGILYHGFIEIVLGQMNTGARNVSILAHARDLLRPDYVEQMGFHGLESLQSLFAIGLIAVAALALGAALFTNRSYDVGGDK